MRRLVVGEVGVAGLENADERVSRLLYRPPRLPERIPQDEVASDSPGAAEQRDDADDDQDDLQRSA
jgi:hypothetical protein